MTGESIVAEPAIDEPMLEPAKSKRFGRTWLRILLAAISGVMIFLAFPPVGWWWLAPFGVALFTFVTGTARRYRSAFGYGLVAGFLFFGLLLGWLSVLGDDAWFALSLYCALWIALQAMANRLVMQYRWWPLAIAALWVLQEALRGRYPLGGFPWGRLAFSQDQSPLLGLASLGGAPLITFAVALTGTCLLWLLIKTFPALTTLIDKTDRDSASQAKPDKPVRNPALALGILAAILIAYCLPLLIPKPVDGQTGGGPATATVALVQGSVPNSGLDAMAQRRAVLNNHVEETLKLAQDVAAGKTKQPELVIWPENSVDVDPISDELAAQEISQAADAIKVPILIGAVVANPLKQGTLWNAGIVWSPGSGPGDFYVKRHPVPFGEYLPGREVLTSLISRFQRVPYDFEAGTDPGVLQVGPAKVGDVICFEVAYDSVVTDVVKAGGRVLSVQTNNATFADSGFGATAQPQQQAAMSAIRAVEHGRAVLVAATSGVTAIFNPAGQIEQEAPMYASTYLLADVPLRDSLTIADQFGWISEWIIVGLVTLWLVVCVVRVRQKNEDVVVRARRKGKDLGGTSDIANNDRYPDR